ncbi:restriction endonuclease subunit S [Clostridioides difficile]|jgi:type I restriction enzyme S subunit|uniref:restriction endonuclease subunit S n=1 Tax=Clostridioides difficile TaxID=1496 RepID=UPI0009421372|nr:restriction endonuclease subunit S [Clostridioides difficile]EGT3688638.1 restriction endonuclease subunit S [Clostridioides difficile]EKG0820802.1 restriction endonuclease subunit S [Clostridioides difficile]MBF9946801.1 restriction endonuclease subunit S [Clostridioides difficile]MBH7228391.1 restriction endonuclease subunit S [Clostridioides difficile]MBH7790482.1 restriction endonuclease subunit S [Clostridioides difficile]
MVAYPEDWKSLKLKDIGYIQMCRRIFQEQTKKGGQIPFYKIGTFGGTADAYISRELFEQYRSMYPYPVKGDVLLSAAGTIGKTVIFDGRESYFQDSNIVWLKVDENEIDHRFLYYFYESFPWKALEGTTIGRLYNNIILNTNIHLPTLPEQQVIASVLSDFDEHLENLSKLIEKKKAIRDGALEDLVSGRTRIKGFDKEWETVLFDQVIVPKARIGWQGLKKEEYLRDGYSYLIGGTDFHNGKINLDGISYVSKERYDMDPNIQVETNNVLVTKDGTIGKVALVPELDKPATLNSGVFVFRTVSKLHPTFLYRVLLSSIFREFIDTLSAGSTIKHLYQKDLKNFEFRIPLDIEEQQAIADVLTAMDEEIEALEKEKVKIKSIKEGAMDDLLSGRVRLKI